MQRLTDSVGIRWPSRAQVGLKCGRTGRNAHSPGRLERHICLECRAWEGHRTLGNEAVP